MHDLTRAALAFEDTNITNVGVKMTMKQKTVDTRHGTFTIYDEDELVGMSLVLYGEYSEGEVEVFRKVLRPGDVAIDVGANIGALTVPMAKLVTSPDGVGAVYAFEASGANLSLLRENINQNDFGSSVIVVPHAASNTHNKLKVDKQSALHAYCRPDINDGEFEVECSKIDDLQLGKCKLIKIDVDGHELQVLNGAAETIARCKPVIYIENEIDSKREAMVAWLVEHGYRLYWHRPYMYNVDNWRGEKRNIFGSLISMMNVCVPDEEGYEIKALDEVFDHRNDDLLFEREHKRYLRYVDHDPDDADSRWMAAYYANLMQWRDKAHVLIDENISRCDHVPTKALLALMNLQDGNYNQETWEGYEIRHKQANRHKFGADRTFPDGVKRWDGTPTDEPLLIWTEQGYGDNIMFVRFFKHVLERAPNAFLECRPELFELFEYSKVASISHGNLFRLGRSLPPYTLQLSLPSTAWALGVDKAMIKCDPYLDVDPGLIANWRGQGNVRLGQTPDGPLHGAKIGLCTTGSSTSERPYTRDLPKGILTPLVQHFGPVFPLEQQGQFESYAQTAGAIKALDLVITVDTSIAHLAGALGVPTWLLLSWDPDWRWGLKGDTTIWYDSIKIFRQHSFRNWASVIEEVMVELEKGEWCAEKTIKVASR